MAYLLRSLVQVLTIFVALVFVFTSGQTLAGSDDIVVENAWSRASIGTARPGVAYMTIRNHGDDVLTLSSVKTDLAAISEIHQTSTNDQGVSSMARVGDLDILPNGTIALEPGGLHLMLTRLQQPMVEGETYALSLVFGNRGSVVVRVPILGFAARGPRN